MATRKLPERKFDDIEAAWLSAKASDPLLDRREYARVHNLSLRRLERTNAGPKEREILSKHIADMVSACAAEIGVEPSDLKWSEFAAHFKILHGVHPNSTSGLKAHHLSQVGGFATVRDAYFPKQTTDRAVESQRISDHAAVNRRLGAQASRQAFTLGMVEQFAQRVFSGRVDAPVGKVAKLKEQRRVVTALWSDLHFGSDTSSQDTGLVDFGRVEEARAFAQVVSEIADYKPDYRATTTLRILSLGDTIEGKLHDREDGAAMAEQVCRSIHLMIQGIAFLARAYPEVEIFWTSGNHDRDTSRHPKRATSHKTDSYGTLIGYAIKTACANLHNVKFHIPQTSYFISTVFGQKTFGTHGDGVLSPGNPGKVIAVGQLENQVNRINADLRQHSRDNGEVIDDCMTWVMGHVHTPMVVGLPNGATLITNGALQPTTGFGVNGMGRFSANRGQWVYESVEGYPVGDMRFLKVGNQTHFNHKLDNVIKPWSGL